MSYRDHSIEEKLEIIKKIESGSSLRSLSREYGILLRHIIEWNRRYKLYGIDGLKKKEKNQRYDKETKKEILDLVLKKRVSLPQVAVHYGVSDTTVRKWIKRDTTDVTVKKVRNERPERNCAQKMKKVSKVNPKAFEQLLKENERLRVENALLKKVRALVAERENLQKLNGSRPSKN